MKSNNSFGKRLWNATLGRADGYTALKAIIILPCFAFLAVILLTYLLKPDAVTSDTSEIQSTPAPRVTDAPPVIEAKDYEIGADGYYTIYTYAGLIEFADKAAAGGTVLSARLGSDIVAEPGHDWVPLGVPGEDGIAVFSGTFDGNGHTVSGLSVSGESYVGFIGCLDGGAVTNLTLSDCVISGLEYIGGICGKNLGTISGCVFSGTVGGQAGGIFSGGITGANFGTINDCSCLGSVSAASYSGGIAGVNYSDISGCSNSGSINSTTAAGGIAGINEDGTIKDCLSDSGAIIQAENGSGGITGINNSFGMLADCLNSSQGISADVASGAIVGINYGNMYGCGHSIDSDEQIFDSAVTVGLNYGTIEDKVSHDGN